MGGVEVPQAPRGVSVGRTIPLPTGEGSGEGSVKWAVPRPPQKISRIFVENTIF